MRRLLPLLILVLLPFSRAQALQLNPRVFVSPITGKPFQGVIIPVTSGPDFILVSPGPADMGVDSDGCRHTSESSEYDYFLITCPYSFFTALSLEWDEEAKDAGRFRSSIDADLKQWVTSSDGFNTEWQTTKNKLYQSAKRSAEAAGRRLPGIDEWVIPQEMIPLDRRYQFAMRCYAKRGASDLFLGRLAMTAAWAVRARLNKPISDPMLAGGVDEVILRVQRHIVDGESFDLDKFYGIYQNLFENVRLSEEGWFVSGLTYFGLALRKGDLTESLDILERMRKRFDKDNKPKYEMFRGIIRSMRQSVKDEYLAFLDLGASHLIKAMAQEEVVRAQLPQVMLVTAEFLRRLGPEHEARAAGWYRALGEMAETEPALRAEIRAAGKMPSVKAPYPMLVGWAADEQLAALGKSLARRGIEIDGDKMPHKDARLLNAIVHEALGTPAYRSTTWQPNRGAKVQACHAILREAGLALIEHVKRRAGEWPNTLDDLWTRGYVRDRNRLNRFHCPVTGKPFLYDPLPGDLEEIAPGVVLLATSAPVEFQGKQVYPCFLTDLSVQFSAEPLRPGQQFIGEH